MQVCVAHVQSVAAHAHERTLFALMYAFVSPLFVLYSVYATCDGGLYTLLVCDLPVGILVCLSASPVTVNQAAPLVERVADKLRA